jgi:predicted CopG family antitoxin
MEATMATKTISIDIEAYERLRSAKREAESFSEAIKRLIRSPVDLDEWFAEIDRDPLSGKTFRAIEKAVRERSDSSRSAG